MNRRFDHEDLEDYEKVGKNVRWRGPQLLRFPLQEVLERPS